MICTNCHCDLGRKTVIVAVTDLIRGHGVIFVHDGHSALCQQSGQRGPTVEIAAPVGAVFERDQHLRRQNAVGRQRLAIGTGQPDLAHGRGRLCLLEGQIPCPEAQHPAPKCD